MLTFTLDTYCVIAAINEEPDVLYVDQLVELARVGEIAIARTSGFEVDQQKASPVQRRDNLEFLASVPIVKVPGPLRFGGPGTEYEFFNGDVFAGDDTARLDDQIAQIVLPEGRKPESAGRRMIDVHHLTAHLIAGHDVFVTGDKGDIVKKRDRLRSEVGIVVMTPSEAVAIAIGHAHLREPTA